MDAWVVFDGCEPDAEVMGVAQSIEGIWRIIDSAVERGHSGAVERGHSGVMKFLFSDVIRVEVNVRNLYDATQPPYDAAWLAQKFSVVEA